MFRAKKLEGYRVAFVIVDEDHTAVAGGQCLRELLIRFSEKTDELINVQERCSKNCTEDCTWVKIADDEHEDESSDDLGSHKTQL